MPGLPPPGEVRRRWAQISPLFTVADVASMVAWAVLIAVLTLAVALSVAVVVASAVS